MHIDEESMLHDYTYLRKDGVDIFLNAHGSGYAVKDKYIIGAVDAGFLVQIEVDGKYQFNDSAYPLDVTADDIVTQASLPAPHYRNPESRRIVERLFIIPLAQPLSLGEFVETSAKYLQSRSAANAESEAWQQANQHWRDGDGDAELEYQRLNMEQSAAAEKKHLTPYDPTLARMPLHDDQLTRKMLMTLKYSRLAGQRNDAVQAIG